MWLCKRISIEVQKLQQDVKNLFILDVAPAVDISADLNGTDVASSVSCDKVIIEGRILPTAEPYCQRSFRVKFTLPKSYPFDPPTLYFLDPIYHPNIDSDGKICLPSLNEHDCYKPKMSLSDFIIEAEGLFTDPSHRHVINRRASIDYANDRVEFNRKALELVLRYGLSRT
jgi:ubiquitin-protein ligase